MSGTLYFGCGPHEIGHYFWEPGPRRTFQRKGRCDLVPWREVDGVLAPGFRRPGFPYTENENQIEGWAARHHKKGWTAISWWDRSVDNRHGSNSTVFVQGEPCPLEEVLDQGRFRFPWVFSRIKFEITLTRGPQ